MNKQGSPKVIAITSGKGGVGKTNVVANLAVSLSKMGRSVVVLDADLGLGNLDVLLGLASRYNLGHLLRGERTLEEIMIQGPGKIKIIPAASGIQELTNLSPEQKMNLFSQLGKLNGQTDYMLIDTAAGISQNVLFFNIASQEIIVVASPEPTSIIDAYALMKVLHLGHGEKRFKLLVNSAKTSKEGIEVYKNLSLVTGRYLNVSVDYIGFIPYDENLQKVVRAQRAVVEMYPDSKSSRNFALLAKAVDEFPAAEMKDNIQFFFAKAVSHFSEERL